uniref:ABC transporter permease subunit n=1 Tax=Desulfobacca acetoxidans TaxID=60893 RepID=A0A7C5ENU3_9BACT
MKPFPRLFKIPLPDWRPFSWGDAVVFVSLGVLLYLGIRLGMGAPAVIKGPEVDLSPGVLPYYVSLSLGRMAAAYLLSLVFSLAYGYLAANRPRAEKIMLPLLDVLQSVPILSFLPVVLLSFSAFLSPPLATEAASIVLIFTSQAWNLTFAWYQSLTTLPRDLVEASTIFRLNPWLRFKTLELPFAALTLIWNSMMSWAGGWFFLMAAEIFTAGEKNYRLLGLGAYLQEAANQGNLTAVAWGLAALVGTIVALDQLIWRPLLAWGNRFTMSMVEDDYPPTSWFYDALRTSKILEGLRCRVLRPMGEALDFLMLRLFPPKDKLPQVEGRTPLGLYVLGGALLVVLLYQGYRGLNLILGVSLYQWGVILLGLLVTLLRVLAALIITLSWTLPLGVAIGTNPRLAAWLQPVVQVTASIPATALFPVVVLLVIGLPGGLNLAAVLLMLMGTQWYMLFNIIAGAAAIPRDLKFTTALLQLGFFERWRTLFLPALFPYMVTGARTASGGAWNASIVAEYLQFGGETLKVTGIGAVIAEATASGDYAVLLAATLSMIIAVATINRLVWRRLYQVAEERYRMD